MEEVPASRVNAAEHVGRIDQSGFEIVWVDDIPLYPHGATVKVAHIETGVEQVWDLSADCTLWLRDEPEPAHTIVVAGRTVWMLAGEPRPGHARWTQIAEQVAREVTSS